MWLRKCQDPFAAFLKQRKKKKKEKFCLPGRTGPVGRFPGLLRHGTVREGARQAQDEGLKPPLTLGVTGRLWDEN